jgi:hypothetical protein
VTVEMVGTGGAPMSRELTKGVRLALYTHWEGDGDLVYSAPTIDGTLPGEGCTAYALAIEREGDLQSRETLMEFHFRGGGDLRLDEAPAVVRRAFEEWYGRLTGRIMLPEI